MMMSDLQRYLRAVLDSGECDFKIMSYSGRFMYGRDCLAIAGDSVNLMEIALRVVYEASHELEQHDLRMMIEDVAQEVHNMRWDQLGLGMVYYWPNVSYVKQEEEDEEDPTEFDNETEE